MSKNYRHFGKIGVLMGGYSSEREISLKSGKAIYQALLDEDFNVFPLDIIYNDEEKIISYIKGFNLDIAFIALHGKLGEDGTIQAILEKLEVPYIGSGVKASQLAINKDLAQSLLLKNNINVPAHIVVDKDSYFSMEEVIQKLKQYPIIVKPTAEGSSIGINIAQDEASLQNAVHEAFRFGSKIIIEQYIKGREMTVGILGEQALPVIEISTTHNFFDYTAKYQKGFTEYIVPAKISEDTSRTLQDIALRAHQALGCEDFSRVDIILSAESTPYVLEINTIPGFTATSLLPKAAAVIGLSFNQLCVKLTEMVYGKKKNKLCGIISGS